jgi:xylan 1,4-beta-xylosidase
LLRQHIPLALLVCVLLALGGVRAFAGDDLPPADPPVYNNPVMSGDFPDPTAVRIGPEYWAIATRSGGQPQPPILRSPDLVHWEVVGYLSPDPPPWSSGRQLWGPWLDRRGDEYLVYYSARKKYGRPCVTVGYANNPIGPYTDSGPLVCQPNASIDPSVVRNVHGTAFLVWKENGGDHPSSLWVQQLSADGLGLIGPRKKIMEGNRHNWEGGLIEGPRIVQRGGWYFLFYSGGHCCAPQNCTYALGVARSKSIYGPWTRAKNPVLKTNKSWKCPGHGAVLQTPSGHWWLVYNGYQAHGSVNKGRQMLLDLVRWSRKGWPVITPGYHPAAPADPTAPADGGTTA